MKTRKNKQNNFPWVPVSVIHPLVITRFECPLCKRIVLEHDFITSYRLVDGSNPPVFQVKNLCRICRDAGI
jgi:hypothetical protein